MNSSRPTTASSPAVRQANHLLAGPVCRPIAPGAGLPLPLLAALSRATHAGDPVPRMTDSEQLGDPVRKAERAAELGHELVDIPPPALDQPGQCVEPGSKVPPE